MQMSKWYLPLTILGVGSLGILLGTERGRLALDRASDFFEDLPRSYDDFTDAAEREIASIQQNVDQIAAMLGALQLAR